jgi:hypothetical protein
MAAKMNSEFNYRYQVIGETPWEKIKTLKGFLEGRIKTRKLEEVSDLRYKAKLLEFQSLKQSNALPHVVMNLHAEILEIEAHRVIEKEGFELNRQEIEILEKLLAELYEIVEPTRIPGYTDEQMFELNAANEFTAMIAKEIQCEIIANGRPSPAKLRNAMSNPHTFNALKQIGLIPNETPVLIANTDPTKIELTAIPYSLTTNEQPKQLENE